MYKRALLGVATLAATGLFLTVASGTAHAELAGDNGLIVYAQNDQNNNCAETNLSTDQVSQSTVTTTDSTGTSTPVTAATTQDCVTAATVSPPDTSNNNTIVYATDGSAEDTPTAALNKVTVDQTGNPVSSPTTDFYSVPTTSGPGPWDFFTTVSNDPSIDKLSYAPDGTNVVATQSNAVTTTTNFCFIIPFPGCFSSSTTTTDAVVKVDVNSGAADTLYQYVAPGAYLPSSDANIAAAYAQNGVIYFSAPSDPNNDTGPLSTGISEVQRNSDIWYIPAGGQAIDVKRLTNTPQLNEFFLSAAPDSSKLLVCNASSEAPDYYYVSTLDGSEILLAQRAAGYYPIGFSPDGTMLYGDLNQASEFNPCNHYWSFVADATAFSSLDASDPRAVNQLIGVVAWAPKPAAQTAQIVQTVSVPTAGKGGTPTTVPTVLQNTGDGAITSLAFGLAATTGAGATLASRRTKKTHA